MVSSASHTPRDLYQIWMRVINKINESESIPRLFGVDTPLYPSEIHTIQAIGDHPDSNVGAIADHLGITPGASSQVITKLARRDLVKKVRGKNNEKEVLLELTEQGVIAYQVHEKKHEMVFQRVIESIGILTDDELQFLERILNALECVYDERIEVVRNEQIRSTQKNPEELP